jgi:hypothetical protein
LSIASRDLRRSAHAADLGDLSKTNGRAARRKNRDLTQMIEPRPLVHVEQDINVPALGAGRAERAHDTPGQPGAQNAGDLRGRQAKVGRALTIDVDDQLRLTHHAAVADVDRAWHLAHNIGHLARERRQDLLIRALNAHLNGAPAAPAKCAQGGRFERHARNIAAELARVFGDLLIGALAVRFALELDTHVGEARNQQSAISSQLSAISFQQ